MKFFLSSIFQVGSCFAILMSMQMGVKAEERQDEPKKIAVVGTGYVGLVLGTGLSDWGHQVTCVDILEEKILSLKGGQIPFFEPGMEEWVKKNVDAKRLSFTANPSEAIQNSEIIFICVPTPPKPDGSADISAVEKVAEVIATNLNSNKIVCIKSTVPIGTCRKVESLIHSKMDSSCPYACDVTFNPEFLREGSAIHDFMKADRLIVGGSSPSAVDAISQIFAKSISSDSTLICTDFESAESIKYASNAFLATKISFINEFANLCDHTGADIQTVAHGLGLDKRIGPAFLQPGPGYGGSCFPKDTLALVHQGKQHGIDLKIVQATIEANDAQKARVIDKLKTLMGNLLADRKIALLGLAFKPNTDDIRYSPAITLIEQLLAEKAKVCAYDPIAMRNMQQLFPQVEFCQSCAAATQDADAAIIVTDWDEFKHLDLSFLRSNMKAPILIDTRNLYDPQELMQLGFLFGNTGRPWRD